MFLLEGFHSLELLKLFFISWLETKKLISEKVHTSGWSKVTFQPWGVIKVYR